MKVLYSLLFLLACAACGTLDEKIALVNVGDTTDQVTRVFGSPADLQVQGKNEAWQYCISGAGFGWNDHRIIWFYDGKVTAIRSYTTSVTGCRNGIRSVTWDAAPEPSNAAAVKVSQGTCFVAGPNGLVITSHHVVQGARSVTVTLSDGRQLPATIEKSSAANDVAILRIDANTPNYLSFSSTRSARIGDQVFTIGFPTKSILGSEAKFTEGSISALSGVQGESAYMQISVPIQPGNSGGPVVNHDGYVIGIIAATAAIEVFYATTGALPQNVNWAVKSDYIQPMLDEIRPRAIAENRSEAITRTKFSVCEVTASF